MPEAIAQMAARNSDRRLNSMVDGRHYLREDCPSRLRHSSAVAGGLPEAQL